MTLSAKSLIDFMLYVSFIYNAWASALLVLTNRAMPEPQHVGRVTGELPTLFLYISNNICCLTMKGDMVIKEIYGKSLSLHFHRIIPKDDRRNLSGWERLLPDFLGNKYLCHE